MTSDLTIWITPAATLIGVVLGAKLNGNRVERREDRKAILASRGDLFTELELRPRTARIRLDEQRRDRVELMLLNIGLSSWSAWNFLRVLESHEMDKSAAVVDTERRTVIPALAQRRNAYNEAVWALSRYLDGSMSRRRTQRVLAKAGRRIDTSDGRLTRYTRRWAQAQAHAFDPPLSILSTRGHHGPPGTLGINPRPPADE